MKIQGLLKLLGLVILLAMGTSARADFFNTLIGYECDQENDQLIVYYKGAYNKAGTALLEAKTENEWDPWTFIASMKDEDHIGSLKTEKRVCKLKSGQFDIEFGVEPGNYNIQGRCGAFASGWVEVKRRNVVVLKRYAMDYTCEVYGSDVTTRIVFKGKAKPEFTKTPMDNFYL